MRMAEPHDRAIFLVIARAGVPAMGVRIGAQLRHAERQRRAGKGMAVAAGADDEIGLADGKRAALAHGARAERKSGVSGKGVTVRVELGGHCIMKNKMSIAIKMTFLSSHIYLTNNKL